MPEMSVVENTNCIPPSASGYYSESSVVNNTSIQITIIYRNGNKVQVEPGRLELSNNTITIRHRQNSGSRLEERVVKPLDMTVYEFDISEIDILGYYAKDMDIVICRSSSADVIEHPFYFPSYTDTYKKLMETTQQEEATVSFSANDPTGKYDAVYVASNGMVTDVVCTDVPSEEAYCKMFYKSKNTILELARFDLRELDENITMEHNDKLTMGTLIVGKTKLGVVDRVKHISNNYELHNKKELAEKYSEYGVDKLKELQEKHNNEVREHTDKFMDLDHELKKLRQAYNKLSLKYEGIEAKYNTYLQTLEFQDAAAKRSMEIQGAKSKQEEQDSKTQRAAISVGGESVKTFGAVAKVAAGVAVGIIAAMSIPGLGVAAGLLAFI